MSSQLPPIDLTGASVGTAKTLDFNQFVKINPLHQAQHAILACFNESGCGLQLKLMQSGHEQFLPAGGWTTFDIEANDSNMQIKVLYTLPTPPVSTFIAIYYAPGEKPPQPYTLGNSPIGIGGSVQTSSVQTLSNEGGAANVLVEDIGDVANAQLYTLYSDGHALWKVDQAGVAHQVLKINTAGNALQLGQAGDTSEVLGGLKVDQGLEVAGALTADITELVTGIITAAAANIFGTAGNLQHILGSLTVDQTSTLTGIVTAAAANILGTAGNLQHILGKLTVDQGITSDLNNTINGSTTGTATIYQCLIGSFKVAMLVCNNFRNGGAGVQQVLFPVPFTLKAFILVSENLLSGGTQMLSNITVVNMESITTLGAAGGGVSNNSQINQNSFGSSANFVGFDRIQFAALNASTNNCVVLFFGI